MIIRTSLLGIPAVMCTAKCTMVSKRNLSLKQERIYGGWPGGGIVPRA